MPGEKPLDFIKRNTQAFDAVHAPEAPPAPLTPEVIVQKVEAEVKAEEVKTAPEPEPTFELETKPEATASPTEPEADDEVVVTQPGSLQESYKNLNSKFKETKKLFKETQETKARLEKELEEYRTGAVVPEVLKQKEEEIARLSTFEKLYNLKSSKAYQDQVIKPLAETKEKISAYFKDYGVDETQIDSVVNHAMKLTNKAELNRFLSDECGLDVLGAEEVKKLIGSTTELQARAQSMEQEPVEALKRIETENARMMEAKEAERKERIVGAAKQSWMNALGNIRKEGRVQELIPREGNSDHNDKVVKPLLQQASIEYGKLITTLGKAGHDIPQEVAEYLAKMTLLAHASAVAVSTRDAALKRAEEMEQSIKIGNGFFRPQIGGGQPSISAKAPEQAIPSLQDDVNGLLGSVLQKRK